MNVLTVVTPLSIYFHFSTRKAFREVKFAQVNKKKFRRRNVRKNRVIDNNEQYVVLDISLEFGNMEKMKITSSKPKYFSEDQVRG